MRVLYPCEFGSINGAENSLLTSLEILCKRGIEPLVLAPQSGPFIENLLRRKVRRVPWSDSNSGEDFHSFSLSKKRERLADILRKHRPDLVHCNSLSMGRLSGPVLRDMEIPGVSHLRDIIRISRKAMEDLNLNSFLFAVSDATRDFHIQQGADPKKCKTVYNGVDSDLFVPRKPTGDLHREFGIPPHCPLLGNIGQVGLRKAQNLLLDAVKEILIPFDLHLFMIGERFSQKAESIQFERDLRKRADLFPFSGRVHFTGVRGDIPRILPELTLLVHTANQEPLGRVLLESSCCTVPILATRVGGTEEILPNPQQLFPKGDPESLQRKIREFFQSPSIGETWGRESRKFTRERFSPIQNAEKILHYYSKAVE